MKHIFFQDQSGTLYALGALLVILISIFLRFYNLEGIYVFGVDEEYQITLASTLVKDFHIIWIGVSAGYLGFYLGPLWNTNKQSFSSSKQSLPSSMLEPIL